MVGGDTQKIWPAPSEDERPKSPREQGLWTAPAPRAQARREGQGFWPRVCRGSGGPGTSREVS